MNEDYFIEAGYDIITGENEMSPEDFADMQARRAPIDRDWETQYTY